jgi:uncharacterized protein (DUF1778 family)
VTLVRLSTFLATLSGAACVLIAPYDCRTGVAGGASTMTTKTRPKARLAARIDPELDDLIVGAADRLNVNKTTFVCDAVRDAALKVIARADVTMMAADVFDSMMASIDVADESPELGRLADMPRLISR